jgi:hypothetical protein
MILAAKAKVIGSGRGHGFVGDDKKVGRFHHREATSGSSVALPARGQQIA